MSLMPESDDSQIPVYSPPESNPLVLILVGLMVLFLLFAVGFWLGKGKAPVKVKEIVDPGQILLARFGRPPSAPSELTFIFFNDVNRNGVFDQNETAFKNVSVEFRRRGQEGAFQAVPADSSGRGVVNGLAPADYEVRYSYADFTGTSYGDFNLRTWYQIILPTGATKQMPTDWESLVDSNEVRVGITEYIPDKLIIGQTKNQLWLIDPAIPEQVYGQSTIFTDDLWHRFTLLGGSVYYLYSNELKQFDFKNRLTQTAIKPAYGIDGFNYRLSPDVKTLIYLDNGELSYLTRDDWCGQGAVFDADGWRLTADSLLVNFRDSQQLVAVARIANQDNKVYLIGCKDGHFEAFATDWGINTVAPEPTPASWHQGDFRLDILLGEVDLWNTF